MDKEKIKNLILGEIRDRTEEIEKNIRSLKSVDKAIESLKEEEKRIEERVKKLFDLDIEGGILEWYVRTNGQIRVTEPIMIRYEDTRVSLEVHPIDLLYTDPFKLKKDKWYKFVVLAIPVEE